MNVWKYAFICVVISMVLWSWAPSQSVMLGSRRPYYLPRDKRSSLCFLSWRFFHVLDALVFPIDHLILVMKGSNNVVEQHIVEKIVLIQTVGRGEPIVRASHGRIISCIGWGLTSNLGVSTGDGVKDSSLWLTWRISLTCWLVAMSAILKCECILVFLSSFVILVEKRKE